ncbi:MAG: hypothetical protein N3D72_01765 [Candidatus Methanomethyliaceae archaeon]|nr:hypothetical protein [Candidatus Methanomethyliaceae archaeon]
MLIGIIANDIKASYEIVEVLKELNVPFVLLESNEFMPSNVCAIISSKRLNIKNLVLYEGNAKRTALKAISICKGREEFEEVIVGIDPGVRVGIVVLADGDLLEARIISNHNLEETLHNILIDYPSKSFIFKIGKGEISKEALFAICNDNRVRNEFVKEDKLPIPPKYRIKRLKKDLKSALIIALSKSFR